MIFEVSVFRIVNQMKVYEVEATSSEEAALHAERLATSDTLIHLEDKTPFTSYVREVGNFCILKRKNMNMTVEVGPSITFLNGSGDITITWDEHNKEQIIEMIKKKMSEGYTFFTTKKIPLVKLYRRVKVTEANLESCEAVVLDDEAFEKMVASVDDRDVASQVRSGTASFARPKMFGRQEDPKIERDPHKVVESKAVAVRKVAGG